MFATKSHTTATPSRIHTRASDPFIQPKLNVGKPRDKYEIEADRMADQIVAKTSDSSSSFFAPAPTIQRQNNEDLQTQQEDMLQEKPLSESITPLIQTSAEEEVQEKATEDAPEETIQQKVEDTALKTAETPDTQVSEPKTPIQKAVEENIQEKEDEEIQEKEEEDLQTLQMQSSGGDENPSSGFENNLNSSKGGGSPLSSDTRQEMESGFGADFSGVRVHNDSNAVQMNQQLGSQAFANGSDIYFNEGKYNPGSNSGKHLLAHELTHTVQQGGAGIQRKPLDISSVPEMIQGFGFLDLVPDWIIDNARNIPGYTLFTVIITYDPLTGRNVDRTAINLVQGLLELVPVAGPAIFDKLQEYGILETAFDWISGKLSELNLTSDGLLGLVEEAWEELEFPYTNAIDVIADKFDTLLNRVIRFAGALIEQLLTWVKDALIDVAEPYLEENQAWSLIKKIIHYDPLRGEEVQAETVEILADFLMLIGKETELEQMRERDTLQETADWLDTQIGAFMTLLGQLNNLIDSAWDAIQPENLPNILDNLGALATSAGEFLEGVWDFASTVAIEVLKLIKDSLLGWLSTFAADIPGFTLLTVIIRTNPLTGEAVPRSVQNIIRGFMGLVPGGEAKYQELTESGVIPRAAGQIEALIAQLGMSPASIVQLFTDLWNSFTIDDLLAPEAAFERITAAFGEPILRLFTFVVKVVKILIELLLEIMGIPPDMIANIIANAMSAFEDIKNDPIAFLMNLMDAVKNGFIGFLNNIGTHLLNGLQNWLFGTLADAGVEIPSDLSIRSLLGMAMDVLGITLDNVLERLALKIGPERVEQIRSVLDTLTGVWAFVRDVIERGPIAIWEYIQDQISNLWNVIKEGIMGFIQEKVIQQAIGWLLSFLDVTGIMPVIRGVQTVFNAIVSFIEKLREILGIVNSFVAGIADIARGSIQSAANFLERALADGIPVAISFLAKQLGLGDISEKIAEMIENTREMINEGIDWLIDKALEAGTAFLNALGLGGDDAEEEAETTDEENGEADVGKNMQFQIGEENHRLWIDIVDGRAVVMMASEEKPLKEQDIVRENEEEAQQLHTTVDRIESEATQINNQVATGEITAEQAENEDNTVEQQEDQLPALINELAGGEELEIEEGFEGIPEIDKTISVGGVIGSFHPNTSDIRVKYQHGYIGNIPMGAGGTTPSEVAALYQREAFTGNEGLSGEDEIRQRFAMVIGVNSFADLENNNEETVANTARQSTIPNSFPMGVFGFLWKPRWRKKINGERLTFDQAKERFNNTDDDDLKNTLRAEEDRLMQQYREGRTYPYGVFRDIVLQHPFTGQLRSQMEQRTNSVFVHTGDPDVVSLQAIQIDGLHQSGAEGLRPVFGRVGEGLFNRYDQILSNLGDKAVLVSGGYQMSMQADLNSQNITLDELATFLASLMDMEVRRSMAQIDPQTVYFPEPNTLIRLTPVNDNEILVNASFGQAGGEMRHFIDSLAIEKNNGTMHFVDVSVITGVVERFVVNGHHDVEQGGNVEASLQFDLSSGLLRPNLRTIRAIINNQSQTHASTLGWAQQVGGPHGISRSTGDELHHLSEIRNHFFAPLQEILDARTEEVGAILTRSGKIRTDRRTNELVADDDDVRLVLSDAFDQAGITLNVLEDLDNHQEFISHFASRIRQSVIEGSNERSEDEIQEEAQGDARAFVSNANALAKAAVNSINEFIKRNILA